MNLSRRSLFAAAASAAAALKPSALEARKLKSIGVQLYTVRSVIDKDPAAVLGQLDAAGYREAELVYGNLDKIWPALTATSLKPVSIHLPTEFFTKDRDKLAPALEDAKKRGIEWVVCPYIAPKDRGGLGMIKGLAVTLNEAGEKAKAAGLRVAYHNHAFEFAPAAPGESRTLFDVLLEETHPKNVAIELDAFWVTVTGNDPVELLRKQGKRIAMLHVKDMAPGVAKRFDEGVPRTAFKEVGAGELDIKALLHAASEAGVSHYFVEQDQTPGDPVVSLKQSIAYLKKLDF